MRPASLSRRFVAALSSALLLQLTLLGSGTLCGMRGGPMGAATMPESMHDGMQHAVAIASPRAAVQASAVASSPVSGCDTRGDTSTCGNPWSTGSCTTMSGCAVAMAAPATRATHLLAAVHAREIAEPLSAPLGPSFAPELPPPRA